MRLLFIGAHPDDADFRAAGTAKQYVDKGHEVLFVSVTNGDAGHHELRGPQLTERRRQEAFMASNVIGVQYQIMRFHDGRLVPSIELRDQLINLIRQFNPDIVFTHRPYDYHPDHRVTAQMVQDASYLLTVPAISPQVTHLRKLPAICFLEDRFQKPVPFDPEVLVSIDDEITDKINMLHCHTSQVYEWLPYNQGMLNDVPEDAADRLQWLAEIVREEASQTADEYRGRLIELYGEERGKAIKFAEAFEICEYGRRIDASELKRNFPFYD